MVHSATKRELANGSPDGNTTTKGKSSKSTQREANLKSESEYPYAKRFRVRP